MREPVEREITNVAKNLWLIKAHLKKKKNPDSLVHSQRIWTTAAASGFILPFNEFIVNP